MTSGRSQQRKNPHSLAGVKLLPILFLLSLFLNVFLLFQVYERDRVVGVADGDTVDLRDGRRVRLRGVDAPERGRCMADEAREFLTTEALGQHVRLHEEIKDEYGRTLAIVIVGDEVLNERLLRAGLAKKNSSDSSYNDSLNAANVEARQSELGIYSTMCKQTDPVDDCVIKGNIRSGKKQYYLPTCKTYDQVIVDKSFGDVWLCSEDDAKEIGFTLASSCL